MKGTAPPVAKKESAVWREQKITKQNMEKLDFSQEASVGASPSKVRLNLFKGTDETDDEGGVSDETAEEEHSPAESGFFSRITALVKGIASNQPLTAADMDTVLGEFKTQLMAKNVAMEVADQLVASVKTGMLGKRVEGFTGVKATLHKAITEAMDRVLTQKRSIDVLRMAHEARERGRIFSICFLGVNGVGKSTNLAKVAYYLKQKGNLKVLIAACDTFRAGAVEQLRTHAKNLEVQLFEQGYGKDAAGIAKNAMKFAAAGGYEVVLIDTAGRMQDNEPLMRALAKLVVVNSPDLVLFVGEALVGNDAIDQLQKFNRSLIDYAPTASVRGVDGIILTKFDTVDDKVGAALSMAYISGLPIVFVGTGQKYTHLRRLKVASVLTALIG